MSDTTEHGPVITVPGRTRRSYRLSVMVALAVGVLALVAGAIYGGVTYAAFGCAGLALGALNNLLVLRSVLAHTASEAPSKAALMKGVGLRLALVTSVALVLAFVFYPFGMATFLGLALFQVINTIVGAAPALKELRQ